MVVTRKRKTEEAGLDKVADTTTPKVATKGHKSKQLVVHANVNSEYTRTPEYVNTVGRPDSVLKKTDCDSTHLGNISLASPSTSNGAQDSKNSKCKTSHEEEKTETASIKDDSSSSSETEELSLPNQAVDANQTEKHVAPVRKSKTKQTTGSKKQKGCATNTYIRKKPSVSDKKSARCNGKQKLSSERSKKSCRNSNIELTSSGSGSDESSQNNIALPEVREKDCEFRQATSECETNETQKKLLVVLKKLAASKTDSAGLSKKKATAPKTEKTSHHASTSGTNQMLPSEDGSSSESEWEDVAEAEQEMDLDDYKPDIPKEGVQITIEDPFSQKKRKKHQFDFAAYARRQINRFKKDVQLSLHKVHLLCFIALGIFVNRILIRELLRGAAMSILPPELKVPKKTNLSYLSQFVDWYRKEFTCDSRPTGTLQTRNLNCLLLEAELLHFSETRKALTVQNFCFLFVVMGRVLGLDVRLCIAVNPISFKAKNLLTKKRKIECIDITGDNSGSKEETASKSKTSQSQKTDGQSSEVTVNQSGPDEGRKKKKRKAKSSKPKKNVSLCKSSTGGSKKMKRPKNQDHGGLSDHQQSSTSRSQPRRSASKVSYKDDVSSGEDGTTQSDDNFEPTNVSDESDDDFEPMKVTFRKPDPLCTPVNSDQPHTSLTKSKKNTSNRKILSSDSEDEFTSPRRPAPSYVHVISDQPGTSLTKLKKSTPNRKILSSDSEEEVSSPGRPDTGTCTSGIDYWAEVYLNQEKRWICVDCFQNIIDKPYEIESNTSHPISYVLSFNKDGRVKDVTCRYASAWLTDVRKSRVDSDWWEETLEPFAPRNDKKEQEENKQIQTTLMDKPLPTTISHFKNHPLYVLKRHLLKFEGLYPPDAPSLGFVRGEAVYARECVYTLHSRETWRKQARSVKVGEEPYKIVKARPKWDKMALKIRTDIPLEVFGEWQTEKYVPPTAKDGKVPRNEYGNVELFQPEMLPKGTVHIQLPGLNRVARKLGIDCSAAVVGFESHNFGVGPVFDGWVVCKEFKETLLLAWDEEQVNIRKKEQEKREKRIYGNWKRLIKGLLIREKIKAKYLNTAEASGSSSIS